MKKNQIESYPIMGTAIESILDVLCKEDVKKTAFRSLVDDISMADSLVLTLIESSSKPKTVRIKSHSLDNKMSLYKLVKELGNNYSLSECKTIVDDRIKFQLLPGIKVEDAFKRFYEFNAVIYPIGI